MNVAPPLPEVPVGGAASPSTSSSLERLTKDAALPADQQPTPDNFAHQFERELSEQADPPPSHPEPSAIDASLAETPQKAPHSPLPQAPTLSFGTQKTEFEADATLSSDESSSENLPQQLGRPTNKASSTPASPTSLTIKAPTPSATASATTPTAHSTQSATTRDPQEVDVDQRSHSARTASTVTLSNPTPEADNDLLERNLEQTAKPAVSAKADRQELHSTRPDTTLLTPQNTQQNPEKPAKKIDLKSNPESTQGSGIQTARRDLEPLVVEAEPELETEVKMRAKTQPLQERPPVTTALGDQPPVSGLDRLPPRPLNLSQNNGRPLEPTLAPVHGFTESPLDSTPGTASLERPTVAKEIEQLQNVIKDHALLIKRFNQESLTAEIRPDGKTPITLSLQTNGDSIIVNAILDARNMEWMRQHWHTLQARLAEQNIILEEPTERANDEAESFTHNEDPSQSSQHFASHRQSQGPSSVLPTETRTPDEGQSPNDTISTEKVYWA